MKDFDVEFEKIENKIYGENKMTEFNLNKILEESNKNVDTNYYINLELKKAIKDLEISNFFGLSIYEIFNIDLEYEKNECLNSIYRKYSNLHNFDIEFEKIENKIDYLFRDALMSELKFTIKENSNFEEVDKNLNEFKEFWEKEYIKFH